MALGLVGAFGAEACHFIALAGPGLVAKGWTEESPEMGAIEDASIFNVIDKAQDGIVVSAAVSAVTSLLSEGKVKVLITGVSFLITAASIYSRVSQYWTQYQQLPKHDESRAKPESPPIKEGKQEIDYQGVKPKTEMRSFLNKESLQNNIYVDTLTFIFLSTAGLLAKSLSAHLLSPRRF